MRYLSLFSGIEAASVAWEPLGWEPVAFCEVDPFPSAVLAYRFPDVPNLGDVTKIDWSDFAKQHGSVDLVCGGSPCQSFSVAGKREGLSGASGLMWEYVRAVRELRPRYFVWENVPGALSSGKGEDFRCLLEAMDDIGYGLAWRVLDAQFFGVAQRRRRVWLVGVLGDAERAAEILFERESLRWDNPSSRDKRQELAGAAGAVAGSDSGDGCLTPWDVQSRRIFDTSTAWPALYAGDGGGHGYALCATASPPAVAFAQNQRDEVRLCGGDGSVTGALPAGTGAGGDCFAIAGNIIDRKPENGGHHLGIEDDGACYSLTTADRHAVAYAMRMRQGKPGGGKGPLIQTDISGTLATGNDQTIFQPICMAPGQANAEILYNQATTLCARQYKDAPIVVRTFRKSKRCHSIDDDETWVEDDVTPTLDCFDIGDIRTTEAIVQTTYSGLMTVSYQGLNWVVRRLMPIECERLQGFPDNFTKIPYRGKDADKCPDGPRYKALGNSWAVPCARWIGERIAMSEQKEVETRCASRTWS